MSYKSPKEILVAVDAAARHKVQLSSGKQLLLGFMAGMFIAMGAMLGMTVSYGSPAIAEANPGLAKFLLGAVFPVGMIMVVITGGELFTSNTAVIIASRLGGGVHWRSLLRNWTMVYLGNALGAVLTALFLAYWSGLIAAGDGATISLPQSLGLAAREIAVAKTTLPWGQAFLRGVLCNVLVCTAIWMGIAAEDIAGKVLAIWFPVMAFVALGSEHSIANLFFVPLGMLNGANVTIGQFLLNNLLPVTLGNLVGGAGLIGILFWLAYRERPAREG
ncbi:MAG: formate/nitrite transporter family protein [Chloroflexi bacterium]|nr:formate/nitrite transporter family protein [Chloroflexota bacterium]